MGWLLLSGDPPPLPPPLSPPILSSFHRKERAVHQFLSNSGPGSVRPAGRFSRVLRPLSVLVVDDEKNVREGLAKVLEFKGYRTAVASDATSAIEALEREGFDAVIADIRLPGGDGLQLLRRARELKPEVPFIMMTAYGEVNSYLEARNHGAVEYFNKPVQIDDLIAVLTSIRLRRAWKRKG